MIQRIRDIMTQEQRKFLEDFPRYLALEPAFINDRYDVDGRSGQIDVTLIHAAATKVDLLELDGGLGVDASFFIMLPRMVNLKSDIEEFEDTMKWYPTWLEATRDLGKKIVIRKVHAHLYYLNTRENAEGALRDEELLSGLARVGACLDPKRSEMRMDKYGRPVMVGHRYVSKEVGFFDPLMVRAFLKHVAQVKTDIAAGMQLQAESRSQPVGPAMGISGLDAKELKSVPLVDRVNGFCSYEDLGDFLSQYDCADPECSLG